MRRNNNYLCLSIRQPWAWLIIKGYKDIENRSWPTTVRDTIAIHASKSKLKAEYAAAQKLISDRGLNIELPAIETFKEQTGMLIGFVDIIDCVTESDFPWFMGEYGYVLSNPRQGIHRPQKGQLGFFQVNYPHFGNCDRCQSPITIPGLDGYHCLKCGPVKRMKW